MKTTQDLYVLCVKKNKRHTAQKQIEDAADNSSSMALYHQGHVLAYKEIASELVVWFGCEAQKEGER